MRRSGFAVICVASVCLGCGSPEAVDPTFPPVTGTVTLNGKPLPHATVTFLPIGENANNFAKGETDDSGHYELKGPRGGVGTGPGTYAVTVSLMRMPNGSAPPADVPLIESGAVEKLPPMYSSQDRTTLQAAVTDQGGNFDFALKGR